VGDGGIEVVTSVSDGRQDFIARMGNVLLDVFDGGLGSLQGVQLFLTALTEKFQRVVAFGLKSGLSGLELGDGFLDSTQEVLGLCEVKGLGHGGIVKERGGGGERKEEGWGGEVEA